MMPSRGQVIYKPHKVWLNARISSHYHPLAYTLQPAFPILWHPLLTIAASIPATFYSCPLHIMPVSHLSDLGSSCNTDYDCSSNCEFDSCYMPNHSIRVPSPLSLSLISESKFTKSEPHHSTSFASSFSTTSSSSSGASTSGHRDGRNRRNYGRRSESRRERNPFEHRCEEEEENEMELSDEGYDSYDASPRYRSYSRLPRRTRTLSPPRSPFFTSSSAIPTGSSPSFPNSYSLSHPEELNGEAEPPFPDSNSTNDIEPQQHTPTCNETLRRQWQSFALSVQFGVFRTRRRVRGMFGKGRKY
ncbi:hypothetical protein D9757_005294 [Collybiopsis confluens]|uniref:Uncharacterized protein n=1 Tax=Collybiopsis confluens TaxID=2823264 RepID=A0A8H5HW00_9AGAR|nr:hypothetical protein D9757_005294 [Collybiopsis confluens]